MWLAPPRYSTSVSNATAQTLEAHNSHHQPKRSSIFLACQTWTHKKNKSYQWTSRGCPRRCSPPPRNYWTSQTVRSPMPLLRSMTRESVANARAFREDIMRPTRRSEALRCPAQLGPVRYGSIPPASSLHANFAHSHMVLMRKHQATSNSWTQ